MSLLNWIKSRLPFKDHNKTLGQVFEVIDYPLVVTYRDGRINFFNRAFKSHFGHLSHINPLDLKSELKNLTILEAIARNKTATGINTIKCRRGIQRRFRVIAKRIEDKIFWYFLPTLSVEQSSLFHDTPFQRSLDTKYLFNQAPASNIVLDEKGTIQGHNATFSRIFLDGGQAPSGKPFIDLLSAECQKEIGYDLIETLRKQGNRAPLGFQFKNGRDAIAYMNTLEFSDAVENKNYCGFYLQVFDHTEEKKLQLKHTHAQKLQALGQLAGGIAHDFNNLLTAMVGYCDLLLLRHSPGDQSFTDIMQIKQNANRASSLVKQLLAFSRQQSLQPKVLDITDILADISLLLKRLIGPKIELKITHGRDVPFIRADRSQFEQVIINLVVNARDAVKESGHIHIQTSLYETTQAFAHGPETVLPGRYTRVDVKDNGCGISEQVLAQIFDPFFSTKNVGEGTGLGLATVYGIVKQSGGFILVDSKIKEGSQFSLLFPSTERTAVSPSKTTLGEHEGITEFKDLTGSGRILFVEDEDGVRKFACRALRDKGYEVIEACNGEEAMKYLAQENVPMPDLIVTDVVMPKCDGPTLIKEVMKKNPHIEVIYISGYAEDSFRDMLHENENVQFLPKPFSLKMLATHVKEAFEKQQKNESTKRLAG